MNALTLLLALAVFTLTARTLPSAERTRFISFDDLSYSHKAGDGINKVTVYSDHEDKLWYVKRTRHIVNGYIVHNLLHTLSDYLGFGLVIVEQAIVYDEINTIASRKIENFKTISRYDQQKFAPGDPEQKKASKVKDLEQWMALIFFLGIEDLHENNVGVVSRQGRYYFSLVDLDYVFEYRKNPPKLTGKLTYNMKKAVKFLQRVKEVPFAVYSASIENSCRDLRRAGVINYNTTVEKYIQFYEKGMTVDSSWW